MPEGRVDEAFQMVPALTMPKILLLKLERPCLNWLLTCSLVKPLTMHHPDVSATPACCRMKSVSSDAQTHVFAQIRSEVGETFPMSMSVSRIMYFAASSLPLTVLVDLAGLLGSLRGDFCFPVAAVSTSGLTSAVTWRSEDITAGDSAISETFGGTPVK